MVVHPSYPTPAKILTRPRKEEIEKVTSTDEIAPQTCEVTIKDGETQSQIDDQDHLHREDNCSAEVPFVINAVIVENSVIPEIEGTDQEQDRSGEAIEGLKTIAMNKKDRVIPVQEQKTSEKATKPPQL